MNSALYLHTIKHYITGVMVHKGHIQCFCFLTRSPAYNAKKCLEHYDKFQDRINKELSK